MANLSDAVLVTVLPTTDLNLNRKWITAVHSIIIVATHKSIVMCDT